MSRLQESIAKKKSLKTERDRERRSWGRVEERRETKGGGGEGGERNCQGASERESVRDGCVCVCVCV